MITSSKVGYELLTSQLYDENSFYQAFMNDLDQCVKEVIIESPFITSERTKMLLPIFENLLSRNVKIYVITRDPREHNDIYAVQAEIEIRNFERMGMTLLCLGNHHRKLAIVDRKILWEGSLNLLSQSRSREIMRRIAGESSARQMFEFLKLDKFL